jgi:ATP-dependent RNA helicase RhlE
MSFEAFGLAPEILRAVREKNYVEPTPIQSKAIPHVLEGKDLIGCAQTGTGKTAGFTLPVLHRLQKEKAHSLRVLVLVPTRELAAQVYDSVRTYGRYLHLRSAVVIGGVGFDPQRTALRKGVDILVATPGRLLDHMRQRNVSFERLEVLVIDEADRMLDMGFIPDIRAIIRSLPTQRQTLFFSATMPDEIQGLANEILKEPLFIEVVRQGTPVAGVKQIAYVVESRRKRELLLHVLAKEGMDQVLVFTRTRRRADDLVSRLKRSGRRVEALHSDKSQSARRRSDRAGSRFWWRPTLLRGGWTSRVFPMSSTMRFPTVPRIMSTESGEPPGRRPRAMPFPLCLPRKPGALKTSRG